MKLQKMVIQDANRKNWINFWYSIDETTYSLDKGFLVSYKLGMEYNTNFFSAFLKAALSGAPQIPRRMLG
jgi:hypothetical protein